MSEPKKDEEEVDMSNLYKGKPSSFFEMATDGEPLVTNPFCYNLTEDQWAFVNHYIPEHAQQPYEKMNWLYNKAKEKEEFEALP